MPASEIDDIFASKGKKSSLPVPSTSSSQPPSEKLKIRKKKKSPKQKDQVTNEQPTAEAEKSSKSSATKRRIPETVLDPSAPAKTKGKPNAPSSETSVPKAKKRKLGKDEEERFRDSRGTGPRRKTEEGFAIYKEGELGITDTGGDTPLCPFDCQCCF